MKTSHVSLPKNLVTLAQMLERLEQSPGAVNADQFRAVAGRLATELASAPRDGGFDAILARFPAVAELYENLNYQYAGLCRSPLGRALAAEKAARSAIEAARRRGT